MPALSVHCYMAARLGPRTPGKKGSPVSSRFAQHVRTAQTAQAPLVGPPPSHAKRSHPQTPLVCRAGHWNWTRRPDTAAVSRCSKIKRHESCGHQQLGESSSLTIRMWPFMRSQLIRINSKQYFCFS